MLYFYKKSKKTDNSNESIDDSAKKDVKGITVRLLRTSYFVLRATKQLNIKNKKYITHKPYLLFFHLLLDLLDEVIVSDALCFKIYDIYDARHIIHTKYFQLFL